MMSLCARLVLIVLAGVFVVYPLWWATLGPGNPFRAQIAASRDCQLVKTSSGRIKVVSIEVSRSKYPENWRHIVDARNGRNTLSDGTTVVDNGLRWPTVLEKNDQGEDQRRQTAFRLAGVTKTKPGMARDEYPPAVGRSTDAADVKYVQRLPNSRQGASMGGQLRRYCNHQLFKLVAVP